MSDILVSPNLAHLIFKLYNESHYKICFMTIYLTALVTLMFQMYLSNINS